MSERVQHDTDRKWFLVEEEGEVAYMSYLELDEGTVDFAHTWTPTDLRGRGLAGEIVQAALAWARGEGLQVIATCPYVSRYVERHEEWQDVIKE